MAKLVLSLFKYLIRDQVLEKYNADSSGPILSPQGSISAWSRLSEMGISDGDGHAL